MGDTDQDISRLQSRVGQRVRKAREDRGIPRRVLSEMSGVSQRYLSQLESGEGNISIGLLYRVGKALDLPLEGLISEENSALLGLNSLYSAASADVQAQVMQLLSPDLQTPERAGRIALIGLRGAGKTSLGKKAGKKLGLEFIELNAVIEEHSGMPVAEVMELYGQEGYRRHEADALQQVIGANDNMILAVAGGIVAAPETYALLLKHFHTIWLRAQPSEHMERVRAQGDTRPMSGNPAAMAQLKHILATREADYARAEAQLDTSAATLKETADALVALIRQNGFIRR